MIERFYTYLQQKINVTEQQFEQVKELLKPKTVAKGEILLRPGENAKNVNFVAKGCLRSYVIDDKGKEHVIQFAPEDWWIADLHSFQRNEPSMFFIDAIEESAVIQLSKGYEQKLQEINAEAETMNKMLIQNSYRAIQKRLVHLMSASAEERYLDFIKTYSNMALRIPQKMIASFIGVTPESLSRIRKSFLH